MERQYIDLGEQAFVLINGPLGFLNLTVNIFYACCLIFPQQRLKQPSKILLEFLVWCSVMYHVALASLYWVVKQERNFQMTNVSWIVVQFFVHNSMTCSVWLVFCYCIQIVPSQRPLLIWVKRNIKSVIYIALLFGGTLLSFSCAINIADAIIQTSSEFPYINDTWIEHGIDELHITSQVCYFIIRLYILICLCIMTVSSFSTVHCLYTHIRNLAQGSSRFSTPRIQSQMRVTITGISQGVLHFLYYIFYLFDSFTYMFSSQFVLSIWVSFTVTSLYTTGTTVNLGICQTTFRQRAVDVWKALKALCGVGMVTNDVKMHSSQMTSGEIANTITVDVQMSL